VLFREVGELEVEPEGAQDARLALERQTPQRLPQRLVRLAPARSAGEPPDRLDVVEQRLSLLLDEHGAENVPEQANVPPQPLVGRLGRSPR